MKRTTFLLSGIVIGLLGICPRVSAQDTGLSKLDKRGLSKLGQQCLEVGADQAAAWRTVDWQTDLIAAQRMAIEQQKPLFIWAMDGHPLGCT
jgi:hypothetical protein